MLFQELRQLFASGGIKSDIIGSLEILPDGADALEAKHRAVNLTMPEFACGERGNALHVEIRQDESPERQADFLAESSHLFQVHRMAVEGQWLDFVKVDDAAELAMNMHLEITMSWLIIKSVTVIATGDDIGMVPDGLYQVDVPRWFEFNHQLINP